MSKEKQIWEQPGYDFDPPYPASTPVITNYDLIISKTPEKLAGWLCQTQYREGDFCPPKHGLRYCQMADGCRVCWLSWLESPAEVDNG